MTILDIPASEATYCHWRPTVVSHPRGSVMQIVEGACWGPTFTSAELHDRTGLTRVAIEQAIRRLRQAGVIERATFGTLRAVYQRVAA